MRILISWLLKPLLTASKLTLKGNSSTISSLQWHRAASNVIATAGNKEVHLWDVEKGEVICISGCKDTQVSADAYIKGTFNGAMTWALTEVLSNSDKNTTWDYCLTSLREKLRSGGYPQIPQLTSGTKLDFKEKCVNI